MTFAMRDGHRGYTDPKFAPQLYIMKDALKKYKDYVIMFRE